MLLTLLSAVANHLWQSTVFAIAAALLVVVLKKNQAQTRYWIWLAASFKFLIPFSVLINVGSHFSWRTDRLAAVEASPSAFVIGQVAHPFTSSQATAIASAAATKSPGALAAMLPALVLAVWICGSLLMFWRWWSNWRQVRFLVRQAALLTEGRESDTLRRLAQTAGMRQLIAIMSSTAAMEPSVFGIFRPILAWPAGLSARLADEELDAIILHELSHVRRRDNLTAVFHMVVEAMFWFHPLVWWLGMRLVDEREKACDEDVMRWGGASHAYAEGILKVCEFCLESPLVCAAGVTGSNLKRRIEEIMRNRLAHKLSFSRALLLAAAATTALAGPVLVGAINSKVDGVQVVPAIQPAASPEPAAQQQSVPQAEPAIQPESTTKAEADPPVNADDRPPTIQAAQPQAVPQQDAPAPQAPIEVREDFETAFVTPSIRPQAGARRGGPPVGGPGARGGGRRGGGAPAAGLACTGGPAQIDSGRFTVANKTLFSLITMAYGMNCLNVNVADLLSGGPEWIRSDQFDIQALIPEGTPTYTAQQFANGDAPRLQRMLQNLLADRFKLTLHGDLKEMPVYVLSLERGEPKLTVSKDGVRRIAVGPSGIMVTKVSLPELANLLFLVTRRPVQDRTGLTGEFNIDIKFAPLDDSGLGDTSAPSIFTAFEEQLGLRLEAARASVGVVVIDQAEKPSEN